MELLRTLESEKVVVLQSKKNGGYSYGNNFGVKYLEEKGEIYDYIIISNADIDIKKDAIYECLQVLESDSNIAIVAPKMLNKNGEHIRRSSWKIRTFSLDVVHSTRLLELIFYKKFKSGEYSKEDYEQDLLEVEAISGAFFVIRYDIFKQVGMFDENVFLFYEEDILAQKIRKLNKKIVSVNTVNFIHYESQTIGKVLSFHNKLQQMYKSKIYYQEKYNHINQFQKGIFEILNVFRKIELIFEVPIRKLLGK